MARWTSRLLWVLALAVGLSKATESAAPAGSQARPVRALPPRQVYIRELPAAFGYSGQLYPFFTATLPYIQAIVPLTAVAELRSYGEEASEVKGRITFVQPHPPGGPVFMSGNVTGLSPGKHALTIHTDGDTAKGCESMGQHYNPALSNHGGPADPFRHIGDLGNIEARDNGVAQLQESDHVISLVGVHSILGRGLVVHDKPDDLGRGGDMESLRTGNSGRPLACGVIAWTTPVLPQQPPPPPQSAPANGAEEPKK